jgi:2'-5' RNA ligase
VRLFVALNLPDEERARLYDATAALRQAGLPVRWVARDALHLTLEFLGEVAEPGVGAIQSALERLAAGHERLTLAIGGVGAFPSTRRPRVVWLGIRPAPELLSLQRGVEAALEPLGFPGFEQAAEAVRYGATVEVRSVDLMRSHLGPTGARYERIAAAPLMVSSTS